VKLLKKMIFRLLLWAQEEWSIVLILFSTSFLYPLFLSGVYRIFGQNFLLGRVVQAGIASFSIVLLYYLTKEIFDKKIAFIAGLTACFNFTLIHYTGLFGTETFYIFLSIIFFIYLIKSIKYQKINYFILSGIFLGLSSLCRPTILAFIPFVFFALLVTSRIRKLWFFSFITVLMSLLVVFPWTVRNYSIHNRFVLISTNGGGVFWIGLHSGAPGGYHFPKDESNPLYKVKDEVERNRIGYKEGMKFIRNHPKEFIRLMFIKSKQFWSLWPLDAPKSVKQQCVYVILSIIGTFLSIKRRENSIFILLYIFVVWGVHTVVHSGNRYSVPLIPFLCMFASYTLVWVYKYIMDGVNVNCGLGNNLGPR